MPIPEWTSLRGQISTYPRMDLIKGTDYIYPRIDLFKRMALCPSQNGPPQGNKRVPLTEWTSSSYLKFFFVLLKGCGWKLIILDICVERTHWSKRLKAFRDFVISSWAALLLRLSIWLGLGRSWAEGGHFDFSRPRELMAAKNLTSTCSLCLVDPQSLSSPGYRNSTLSS